MDLYDLAGPLLRTLPPEAAHRLTLWVLRRGLVPPLQGQDEPSLACRILGLDFPNPVGLAAGFDKDAEAVDTVFGLGFGFVEVGSVTPLPQPGNPRPRLFRLPEDRAVINRMGFNSAGHDAVAARLASRDRNRGVVGVNLGTNRDSVDAASDYAAGAARFAPLADYLVINVSSPNTPGLRALQGRNELADLLSRVHEAMPAGGPPLLVKIAPDLADRDLEAVCAVVSGQHVDALVVANTTVARPRGLRSRRREEQGGLSGRPLFPLSTEVLRRVYRMTEGKLPLVGVGGIASGSDAYAKIRAGASLVQLYTALVYEGPLLVRRIKRELAALLDRDGFASVSEATGADQR